jgi:hypothetical protein
LGSGEKVMFRRENNRSVATINLGVADALILQ